jgi:hypothetical protein
MSKIGGEILIPQVVIDEVFGKFQLNFQDSLAKLEKAEKETERLLGTKIPTSAVIDLEKVVQEYKVFFFEMLKKNGAKILPYPQVEHNIIVERAINRRKPFKDNGDGYRDTLIWFSLLEVIKGSKDTLFFVTHNVTDFGKNTLFPELSDDLTKLDIPTNAIKIISSLDEYNSLFILPELEKLGEMMKRLESNAVEKFSIRDWIEDCLLEELTWRELADILAKIEQGHAEVNILSIDKVNNFQVDDVRLLPSGDLLVYVTADVSMEFRVHASWEQYQLYDDVQESFGSDDEPFVWATAYPTESADISFSLILQKDTFEVVSSDINEIHNGYYSVEFNSHPKKPVK